MYNYFLSNLTTSAIVQFNHLSYIELRAKRNTDSIVGKLSYRGF